MTWNEFIDAAIKRLRKGWCQGHGAIDLLGQQTDANGEWATAWCAYGACKIDRVHRRRLMPLFVKKYGVDITSFNDQPGTTVEDVIQRLEGFKDAA